MLASASDIKSDLIARRNHIWKKLGPGARYRSDIMKDEPVVDYVSLYSHVVINDYGALVLVTKDMFIADIDIGDRRLDGKAGARDVQEVIQNVKDLHVLDMELRDEYQRNRKECLADKDFYAQLQGPESGTNVTAEEVEAPVEYSPRKLCAETYRIYKTYAGARVICVSDPLLVRDSMATRLLTFLGADPEYVKLCREQETYRARLTKKWWREDEKAVCTLVAVIGDKEVMSEGGSNGDGLRGQLAVHDALALEDSTRDGQRVC